MVSRKSGMPGKVSGQHFPLAEPAGGLASGQAIHGMPSRRNLPKDGRPFLASFQTMEVMVETTPSGSVNLPARGGQAALHRFFWAGGRDLSSRKG